jgi:DNA primase
VSRYAADSRDRVLDAVDMVALVSARTELRRAGVNSYFGLCPFHEERTGSFHVSPDEKLYHCFGCGESGDAFRFVMETEGLDFKGALEALAQRFGVQLETEDEDPAAADRRRRRDRLESLLGRAATYYARYLWEAREAADARQYLLGRGLAEETLRAFRVGYAPSAWDRMLIASRHAGFTEEELLATGLAQRSRSNPGRAFDRFRRRIMFPSADSRGRVLGFGARAMGADQQPKYLNTADGDLYHKREVLYGIDLARASAARQGRMILAEGYTDVLALHQAGLANAVGIMGTSLTEEQIGGLERVVRGSRSGDQGVLELCLDADSAGQEAMLRAARLAAGRRLELRVVPLPGGRDPADLIATEGAEALRELVERSVPFVVFQVERILERADTTSAEGRDRAAAELAPVLALPASALREQILRRVASRLELSEGRLAALIAAGGAAASAPSADSVAGASGRPSPPAPSLGRADPMVRAERAFLVLCVALPDAGRRALAAIDPQEHITSERYRRAARHLAGQTEMPLTGIASDDDDLARVIADLVERAGRAGRVTPEQVEQQRTYLELARLDRAIRRARGGGDGDIPVLAREREDVLERIRKFDVLMESPV